ncbi:c-type cytochrome biogenesis protein CcmI [Marinibactrum halimedae]|uniref:Cytochrome c-type biogenesis protein CycH n=1 Tax=Marinibactrum halimedae TaxID=1444977 RepID=A0AA37TC16_9GAMM|nr:c-type cytochrome biogenesis protein CcmI [Marinibactrum halimedae]MCD9459413.1 c-type cytochrome biogenesis protein CcmI [Marinibactrum halimedae]GLS27521.1 cytochrome c-type biogenesis protein CycH [Marinibactrum halimedae]
MTELWMGAAGLALFAMAFVLWPLLKHSTRSKAEIDQERANVQLYKSHLAELNESQRAGALTDDVYNQLKDELDRSLLEDNQPAKGGSDRARASGWPILIAIALLVPVAGLFMYSQRGFFPDMELRSLLQAKEEAAIQAFRAGSPMDQKVIRDLVSNLEARVENDPENIQAWYHLAQNLMELQEYRSAIEAYKQVLTINPEETTVMAELAQAVFIASGNRMIPEIENLALRVLEKDPQNTTALGLAGIAAFGKSEYTAAIGFWQRAKTIMGNAPGAESLQAGIDRARKALGESAGSVVADVDAANTVDDTQEGAVEAGLSVVLDVSLGESVQANPDQAVFVYARAWNGAKMPLAITRLKVKDLPQAVTLNESMAMMEGMSMASFPKLELVARLSQDGSPMAKPGDVQGAVGPVSHDDLSDGFELIINTPVN